MLILKKDCLSAFRKECEDRGYQVYDKSSDADYDLSVVVPISENEDITYVTGDITNAPDKYVITPSGFGVGTTGGQMNSDTSKVKAAGDKIIEEILQKVCP